MRRLCRSTMDVKQIFGENLRYYRKKHRLSQEELSEKIDVSPKHLSGIERGLNFASSDVLERISDVLEVPLFLFFIQDPENFLSNPAMNVFLNDLMLKTIDKIIERRLAKAVNEIKLDIHMVNGQILGSSGPEEP
jgi:transcriptional regulator with XRE-family HTH domain